MYHAVDEALDVLNDVIKFLQGIDIPSGEEIVEDIKEDLKETLIGKTPDDPKFNADLLECFNNAKKNVPTIPPIPQSKTALVAWTLGCMWRKGYSATDITKEMVERRFF